MNRNNVLALADYIEKDTTPLSFLNWDQCIAGKCVQMMGLESYGSINANTAASFMGISKETASQMFFPDGNQYVIYRLVQLPALSPPWKQSLDKLITRKMVVSLLRNFVITGKVDWQLAIEGAKEIDTAKPPFPTPEEYRVKHHSLLSTIADYMAFNV
jgi:hypothetical protein